MNLPLADIHLPEAVSWWPLAPGWWILLFLFIATIAASTHLYKNHQKKWRHRKAALKLLKEELTHWKKHQKNTYTINHFIAVLKRCAISAYPPSNIQGLHGKAWLKFLNQQTKKPYFNKELEELINSLQYQAPDSEKVNAKKIAMLYKSCEQWIKNHSNKITEVNH